MLLNVIILRIKLENLPGFTIGGITLNRIRYAIYTVLKVDSERTLKYLLKNSNGTLKHTIVKFKRRDCMVVSKRVNPWCELHTEDVKIKQVHKCN